jgi:biotin carboxyl carrier protein
MVALATKNTPNNKGINLKQPTPKKGVAAFIMGLNNRVVRIDQRLTRLEIQHASLNEHQLKPVHILLCMLGIVLLSSISTWYLGQQLKDATQQRQTDTAMANTNISVKSAPASTDIVPPLLRPTSEMLWPLEQANTPGSSIDYHSIKHGISIQSKLGDPVVAVLNGKVIYCGNRIADYGNLILIQHENDLISVYGNTYQVFVKEGDVIQRGQLIAAAGEISGKAALYFELRYKGTPEDPFNYYNQL